MATKVLVKGKYIQRAGVFSTVKSSIRNPATQNSYSNVLIIDDGIGAGFGGGSGIVGTFKSGVDAVYEFDSVEAFQSFVKGGVLWNLAKALFKPSGKQNGVSKVFFTRAATTAPAVVSVELTNGAFDIKTKDEGVNANGVLTGAQLTSGYAGKFIKTSNNKFKFQIWHGTYKGLDAVNNAPWDGVVASKCKPQLVSESPEFVAVADLITWFTNNADFNLGFELVAGSTATGAFVDADLVTYPSYVLAAGGTEVYNAADFDTALTKINNQDYTHILSMKSGADASSAANDKLADFVQTKSKYDRLLVIAGGNDKAERATISKVAAAHFNSDQVIVVHGGVKKTKSNAGFVVYDSLFHAAAVLGRCVGLPSQVPVTLKSIGVDGLVDPLEDDDLEELISAGVVGSYYDHETEAHVVSLDVTTLQQNEFLINDDGTTYCWQLKRIEAELNKFIAINGKKRFFNPEGQGGNRNTTSPEEVTVWAQKELGKREASDKKDDLIIRAENIVASLNQDNISLTYDFVGNTEVKALLSTGTIIEG